MTKSIMKNPPSHQQFLEYFLNNHCYYQNKPLDASNSSSGFVGLCKKRGYQNSKEQLEYLEKKGLLYPIMRFQRPRKWFYENEDYSGSYILFTLLAEDKEEHQNILKGLSEQGLLYAPQSKPFQPWKSFTDEEGKQDSQAVVSFYSSFQFLQFIRVNNMQKKDEEFESILRFLLCIQHVYYPFYQSGGKTISLTSNFSHWLETRRSFQLTSVLDFLAITLEDVVGYYHSLSQKACFYFGTPNGKDDWIQLWKKISWKKKDALQGKMRIAVEYLQLALMIKKALEDHLGYGFFDVDEIGDHFRTGDYLDVKPDELEHNRRSLRGVRNEWFSDKGKSYYHDHYKRLYWLMNDFGLNYQPRIMIFVEGATEEKVFPLLYKWYWGIDSNDAGIEFINYEGVTKFFSLRTDLDDFQKLIHQVENREKLELLSKGERKKLNKIKKGFKKSPITSNWESFLRYHLEKWQIIPFFTADDEGEIKKIIQNQAILKFMENKYNFPDEWHYIWGVHNDNQPLSGKDFEMANFTDEEIATAMSTILDTPVSAEKVKEKRKAGEGVNQVAKEVKKEKVRLGELLVENLLNQYEATKDQELLKRPMFEVIRKLEEWSATNHRTKNRHHEHMNENIIQEEILIPFLSGK